MYKHNIIPLKISLLFSLLISSFIVPAYALERSNKLNNLIINKELLGANRSKSLINFNNIGKFRDINGSERSIMISGKKYIYGINTKVRNETSNFVSIRSIPVNSVLGFNFTVNEKGQRLVYEIWVLPKVIPKDIKNRFVSEALN